MKYLFLALFLLLPIYAQTPLDVEVNLKSSGTLTQTQNVCKRFARSKGWVDKVTINGQPVDNPDLPCDFAERYLEQYVLETIRENESTGAANTAKSQTRSAIDAELRGKKIR